MSASSPWSIPNRKSSRPTRQTGSDQNTPTSTTSTSTGLPETGDHIAQRFQIIRRIGQGGMGIVYEAHDAVRDERVALKFLNPNLLPDTGATQRFLNEARISVRLQHPHILRVYEVHEDRCQRFFSMELLSAENLRDQMNRWETSQNRPTAEEALHLIAPLFDALEYAHRHTVHRDIKPENIAITKNGTALLMDFGIAEVQRSIQTTPNRETLSALRVGTPYYMAPEQIKSSGKVDARADQYSIAVVLYEMLSGELPIGLTRSLAELLPAGYESFGAQVDRALAPNPTDRFPDITSFKAALREHSEPQFHWRQWWRKHPKQAVFTGILLTLLSATGLWRFAQDRINQRVLANESTYSQARRLAEANYQQEQILKNTTLEFRQNRVWLERQFNLERKAWESGLTNFNQWSQLISISNELNAATTLWNRLELLITPNGLPLELNSLSTNPTQVQTESNARTALSSAIEYSNRLARVQADFHLFTSQIAAEHSEQHLAEQAITIAENKDAPKEWFPQPFSPTLTDLKTLIETGIRTVRNQLTTWNGLFGFEEAPDLTFLASPSNHLQRATFFLEQTDYAGALTELSNAHHTLNSWIDEVKSLHQRSSEVWEQAIDKEETDFGMRFIKVGDRYWSLWEVRVMDFARFITDQTHLSKQAGSFWKNPGYPQGPTHPVVGIDRETAQSFSVWIETQFHRRIEAFGSLPTLEDWSTVLAEESQPFKIGLFVNREEWESNHFTTRYQDPGLPAGFKTRTVGLGKPTSRGLFDCFDNLWEWCQENYNLPQAYQHFGKSDTWMLLGGSPHLQISYHEFPPPSGEFVWLARKDHIGFRPTFIKR